MGAADTELEDEPAAWHERRFFRHVFVAVLTLLLVYAFLIVPGQQQAERRAQRMVDCMTVYSSPAAQRLCEDAP